MDLGALREKFVRSNGRMDLVQTVGGDPFADKGANWILNQAQRLLDTLIEHPGQKARRIVRIQDGQWIIPITDLRYVESVTVASEDGRQYVEPLTRDGFRLLFGDDIASRDRGRPTFWTYQDGRLSPQHASDTESTFSEASPEYHDWMDAVFGDTATLYDGIILGPPADSTYTVNVFGAFYSKWLDEDEDVTWWTVQHPNTLMKAANLLLEQQFRNSEGSRDWLEAIKIDLQPIEHDFIERETRHMSEMWG